jgi:hypothetical protein
VRLDLGCRCFVLAWRETTGYVGLYGFTSAIRELRLGVRDEQVPATPCDGCDVLRRQTPTWLTWPTGDMGVAPPTVVGGVGVSGYVGCGWCPSRRSGRRGWSR